MGRQRPAPPPKTPFASRTLRHHARAAFFRTPKAHPPRKPRNGLCPLARNHPTRHPSHEESPAAPRERPQETAHRKDHRCPHLRRPVDRPMRHPNCAAPTPRTPGKRAQEAGWRGRLLPEPSTAHPRPRAPVVFPRRRRVGPSTRGFLASQASLSRGRAVPSRSSAPRPPKRRRGRCRRPPRERPAERPSCAERRQGEGKDGGSS